MKWLMTLLLLLVTQPALAGPVVITSQSLAVNHAQNEAEFRGGVHLVRDDFDLRCDHLTAHYSPDGKGELKRAEAFGRVRMQQGGKRGVSDKAVYDPPKGTLILIGDASVEDADGVVRGEKIVHHIATQETRVLQGSGGRVRMTIESDSKAGGK